jgi:hypothetical protein
MITGLSVLFVLIVLAGAIHHTTQSHSDLSPHSHSQ